MVALTFDAHLHQAVPFAAAITQQAEGSVPAGHGIAWSAGVKQLVSHLVAGMLLQTGVWKGRRVTAGLACQRQHREQEKTLLSQDRKFSLTQPLEKGKDLNTMEEEEKRRVMTVSLAGVAVSFLLTFVFDTESVEVCNIFRGIFCFHIHRFQRAAHEVAHRCPVDGDATISPAIV